MWPSWLSWHCAGPRWGVPWAPVERVFGIDLPEGRYAVASDGAHLVAVLTDGAPVEGSVPDPERVRNYLRPFADGVVFELAELRTWARADSHPDQYLPCPVCRGTGQVLCFYCKAALTPDPDCPNCDGTGFISCALCDCGLLSNPDWWEPAAVLGLVVNRNLLGRALRHVTGDQVTAAVNLDALQVRGPGWVVVVMKMRDRDPTAFFEPQNNRYV